MMMKLIIVYLILMLSERSDSLGKFYKKFVDNKSDCKCIPDNFPCNKRGFKIHFNFGRLPSSCLPGLFLCCDEGKWERLDPEAEKGLKLLKKFDHSKLVSKENVFDDKVTRVSTSVFNEGISTKYNTEDFNKKFAAVEPVQKVRNYSHSPSVSSVESVELYDYHSLLTASSISDIKPKITNTNTQELTHGDRGNYYSDTITHSPTQVSGSEKSSGKNRSIKKSLHTENENFVTKETDSTFEVNELEPSFTPSPMAAQTIVRHSDQTFSSSPRNENLIKRNVSFIHEIGNFKTFSKIRNNFKQDKDSSRILANIRNSTTITNIMGTVSTEFEQRGSMELLSTLVTPSLLLDDDSAFESSHNRESVLPKILNNKPISSFRSDLTQTTRTNLINSSSDYHYNRSYSNTFPKKIIQETFKDMEKKSVSLLEDDEIVFTFDPPGEGQISEKSENYDDNDNPRVPVSQNFVDTPLHEENVAVESDDEIFSDYGISTTPSSTDKETTIFEERLITESQPEVNFITNFPNGEITFDSLFEEGVTSYTNLKENDTDLPTPFNDLVEGTSSVNSIATTEETSTNDYTTSAAQDEILTFLSNDNEEMSTTIQENEEDISFTTSSILVEDTTEALDDNEELEDLVRRAEKDLGNIVDTEVTLNLDTENYDESTWSTLPYEEIEELGNTHTPSHSVSLRKEKNCNVVPLDKECSAYTDIIDEEGTFTSTDEVTEEVITPTFEEDLSLYSSDDVFTSPGMSDDSYSQILTTSTSSLIYRLPRGNKDVDKERTPSQRPNYKKMIIPWFDETNQRPNIIHTSAPITTENDSSIFLENTTEQVDLHDINLDFITDNSVDDTVQVEAKAAHIEDEKGAMVEFNGDDIIVIKDLEVTLKPIHINIEDSEKGKGTHSNKEKKSWREKSKFLNWFLNIFN